MKRITKVYDHEGNEIDLLEVLRPFWFFLVHDAQIDVIDADTHIECKGLAESESFVPVLCFDEIVDVYKNKT